MELNTPLLFDDIQYGVQWKGGCQSTVLGIQSSLDADKRNVAVLVDLANAFNTRERDDIAAELYARQETKPLWRLFDFAYARKATALLVYGKKGVIRHVQSSDNGVRQGCVLASLLYALSMQRMYERSRDASIGVDSSRRAARCFAILDDFTVVGTPAQVKAVITAFLAECKKAGIDVNLDKCIISVRRTTQRWTQRWQHSRSRLVWQLRK